jgi:hypothetical protein
METMYSKKYIHKSVLEDIQDIKELPEFNQAVVYVDRYRHETYYESKNKRIKHIQDISSETLVLEVIAAVCLSIDRQPIQAVSARVAQCLGFDDVFDGIKTAAELISVVGDTTCFFHMYLPGSDGNESTVIDPLIRLNDETIKAIEARQFLPPMVIKPNYVSGKNNIDTSHLTLKNSLILNANKYHHKEYLCTDTINILNRTELKLDTYMLQFKETPTRELKPKAQKQYDQFINESEYVTKEILKLGNKFYLTWKYDFRGRGYSQGYHINLQSTDYKKSILMLAKEEVII